jgi:hypothetical protein
MNDTNKQLGAIELSPGKLVRVETFEFNGTRYASLGHCYRDREGNFRTSTDRKSGAKKQICFRLEDIEAIAKLLSQAALGGQTQSNKPTPGQELFAQNTSDDIEF